MLIVPHPDDEVFSCGGLFTKMADTGKRVATVTLTRGGAGRTLGICPQAELPSVREAELRASLDVLGVSDVHIFDYPDFVPAADRGMAANRGFPVKMKRRSRRDSCHFWRLINRGRSSPFPERRERSSRPRRHEPPRS